MKAATREPSQPQVLTAEEEALKRNTDCVYFLASPLTCKKGIDCEYRHSEPARMNPRDCWYWLNGNCLNPKCSFRHPPLDGLVGTPVASSAKPAFPPSSAKPALPPSLPAASAQPSAVFPSAYNPVKQSTPCYYFLNGLCLKGDRCAFIHGSQPVDHVAPQPPAAKIATSFTELQAPKKPLWGLEKCNQQNKFQQENAAKPVEVLHPVKPPMRVVVAPLQNGPTAEKRVPAISLDNDLSRFKAANAPSIFSGNSVTRPHHSRQVQALDGRNLRNGKEPDEFLGESSPGFDVLVEDELRDSDYNEEDDLRRMAGHGGRHFNTVNEIDYGRSAEYNSVAKFDRETYSDSRGYDTYGRAQDRYPREQRKGSSERISNRPHVSERRELPRNESPEQVDELDLRYRLSKQRRINGARSAVGPDSHGDFYRRDDRAHHVEDQRYYSNSRRDSRYLPHENPVSNRLQGRISLPRRFSPDRSRNDSLSEIETDRGRNLTRLSPGRPQLLSYPGRPQERVRRRVEHEEGRPFRSSFLGGDEADDTIDFAAPKSLVELRKTGRISERGEEQQTDSRNLMIRKFDSRQEREGSSSFEGPKPLREILKRKRQDKTPLSEDGTGSGGSEGYGQKEREVNSQTVASEKQSEMSSGLAEETNANAHGIVEEEEEEEGLISEEVEAQLSTQKEGVHETEDMIMLDDVEDEEFEAFDHRDAEYDYEQVDGDFKTEDDVNPDAEEEYLDDDDDGDDFAKRMGVMFS